RHAPVAGRVHVRAGRCREVDRGVAVSSRAARDPVTRQGPTPPAAHERTGRAERLAKVIRHRDLVVAFLGPSDDRVKELLGLPNDWLLEDRKSTRLNSSHVKISYAVFCLKKKSS